MGEQTLVLKFKTDVDGVSYTLNIKDIKADLNSATVKTAVTKIIQANCIKYKNARLTECVKAEIVTKTVSEFAIV